MLFRDSQNDKSEAWEFKNLNHRRALKRYKWSTRANDKLLQNILVKINE